MQIANPIYDVVFKYLLQNNELAILILSTILDEEIIALDLLPQEISMALENRSFTLYRLDFSARIKTRDGAVKQVVIEIQKAKFAADIMRFRRYLGEHYKQGFTLEEGGQVPRAIPIITASTSWGIGWSMCGCRSSRCSETTMTPPPGRPSPRGRNSSRA